MKHYYLFLADTPVITYVMCVICASSLKDARRIYSEKLGKSDSYRLRLIPKELGTWPKVYAGVFYKHLPYFELE